MKTAAPIDADSKTSSARKKPKITTGAELAEALLEWRKFTTPKDRQEIVAGIEEARRRMNNERLH